jgi:LysR family glycine cleavage system transcriptional activator
LIKKLPPFHALIAFEAVCRHRSFSRAADELCITHSAVSHRIRLLEEGYGVELLQRRNRRVSLTPRGTVLLEAVLESIAILNLVAEKLAAVGQQVVRIGVGHAFARNWLVERLGGFYRQHQEMSLEIYATKQTNIDCINMLKRGEADVAISYGRAEDWIGFQSVELFKTKIFPVCSPAYLSAIGKPRDPKQLLEATLLRLSTQPWRPWFRAAGLNVPEHAASGPLFNDVDLMLNAAVGGQGVALARDVLADYDLSSGRLIRLFDLSIPSDSGYHVVYLSKAKSRKETAIFIDWIVGTARQPAA